MNRGRTLSLSFPPFTPWVKRIVIGCVAVYFLQVVLGAFSPMAGSYLITFGALIPAAVVHGWIWQLITYSFLHASVGHVLINMLMLWMFGAQEEVDWGSKKFLEFYLSANRIWRSRNNLVSFFMMKAKYMVAIMIFLVVIATFQPSQGGIANFAHLGGLLFGFLYIKFLPKRGLMFGTSERYFSLRNSYYRWKRRRAARKFEVYMRKHDRTVTFDEHGNYVPPDEIDKKNGGSKSGWVN
ncbi:MAG: rhomboid family intramembrane serine protease [Acidobacteriia bacterium]|nr:rhomboid family intramembrane serine protease [Terriglobia bacterium]